MLFLYHHHHQPAQNFSAPIGLPFMMKLQERLVLIARYLLSHIFLLPKLGRYCFQVGTNYNLGAMPMNRTILCLTILCFLQGLIGCAKVGPDYLRPDLKAPAAWQAPMDQGLTTAPVNRQTLAEWWTLLNDPLLNSYIHQALSQPQCKNASPGFPLLSGSSSAVDHCWAFIVFCI